MFWFTSAGATVVFRSAGMRMWLLRDGRAVEGVGAAGSVEHADGEVEVEDLQVGDGPVLVVAAVEDEDAFEIHRGEVAGALDAGRTQGGGGDRHVVEVGRDQERVVVRGADDAVVAQRPGGGGVRLGPVEDATEREVCPAAGSRWHSPAGDSCCWCW